MDDTCCIDAFLEELLKQNTPKKSERERDDGKRERQREREREDDNDPKPSKRAKVAETTALAQVRRPSESRRKHVSGMPFFELNYRYSLSKAMNSSVSTEYDFLFRVAQAQRAFYEDNIEAIIERLFEHASALCGKLYRYQRRLLQMMIMTCLETLTSNPATIARIEKKYGWTNRKKAAIIKLGRRSGKTEVILRGIALLMSICPGFKFGYFSIKIEQAIPVLNSIMTHVNSDSYGRSLKQTSDKSNYKSWAGNAFPGDERSIRAISGQKNAKNVCSVLFVYRWVGRLQQNFRVASANIANSGSGYGRGIY